MLCCCPKQFELWSWKHGFVFCCEFNLGVKGTCVEPDDFYVLDFEIAVLRLEIFDIAVLDSTFFKLAAFSVCGLRFGTLGVWGLMALYGSR